MNDMNSYEDLDGIGLMEIRKHTSFEIFPRFEVHILVALDTLLLVDG